MDVRRHATAGRLAELFGEPALESDRFVRTMGWRRIAEQELALIKPETRAALEQYAEGVNAYLEDRTPPTSRSQYTVLNAGGLGYRPEPWTAVDSLAWLKAMAWDLRGNMDDEIDRALSIASVGPDRTEDLYPGYDYDAHQPIVAAGRGRRRRLRAGRDRRRHAATPAPGLGRRRTGGGAACWPAARRDRRAAGVPRPRRRDRAATPGSSTASTPRPVRRSSPTTRTSGVSMPGIWMQMGLHCRTVSEACPLDVSGFTFSGVPGVIIGHNADIAWGFTNLGPDVTDLYVERVRDDEWFRDGEWRPLQTRTETIEVQGQDDETLTIRSTSHGPLLSDVSEDLADVADKAPVDRTGAGDDEKFALALQWTALEPGADRRRDLRPQPGERLGRVPRRGVVVRGAGAEPRLRRPRGPHRLPGARPDPGPQVRQRRPAAGRRAGCPRTTGPATSSRSRRCPGCSTRTRGSSSPPTRPSSGRTTPTSSPTTGTRATAPSGSATCWQREETLVGRGDGRAPDRQPQPAGGRADAVPPRPRHPARLLPRGPGPAARLGLRPGRRTAAPRRTSTSSGATCSSARSATSCPRSCGRTAATAGWRR